MATNTEIERVKERVDIVELIGGHVPLQKAGRGYKACCPFHQERTPSFVVFPETGGFHCFGCGANGDAFSFLMRIEGLTFGEALQRLADRAGITLSQRTGGAPPIDAHRQRLYDANALAAAFYAHVLAQAAEGAAGRAVVAERGISRTSVEIFGLGFAPDGWEALRQHLRQREVAEEIAVEAGLLTRHPETNRVYDRFRNRLLFPIRDRAGRVLGFGGRALGSAQPKYLNSQQSVIFDKSAILYGLDVAAPAIKKADQVVIVEGYVDAIMAHQHGHANVVATMGTALTEQQVGLLKPLTRRLVLALDADAAGQMATLRGITTMREALADEVAPVAVPDRGRLIAFERRLSAEVRILTLPAGEDPDSLLRTRTEAWPGLVERAEPLVDYVIRVVLAGVDPTQARQKSAAVEQLAPLLREVGDPVQQAHYANLIGRRLGIDERVVVSRIRASQVQNARQAAREEIATARALIPPEDYLLCLLLRYPDVVAGLTRLVTAEDFNDSRNRVIWEALRARLPSDGARAAEHARAALEPALVEWWDALLARQRSTAERAPELARAEAIEALKTVRRQQDERRRAYWQSVLREVEAGEVEIDRERLDRELAALIDSARQQMYYPPRSPYFKDIRDQD